MSIETRVSLSNDIKESNSVLYDGTSVNNSDENRGFQHFYREQIEKEHLEDCRENEEKLRLRWDNLRGSRKKNYIKSSVERKRSHSQLSSSDSSVKCSPLPVDCKKVKLSSKENSMRTIMNYNDNDQLFQLEVQRLIASPAHYSFQPVCNACETFSDNANVIRCTGVCLRYFHRDCLEYPPDNPLPADSNFQCVDCWTKIYSCHLCTKPDKITSLLYCEYPDCGRLYHKTCLETSNFVSIDVSNDCVKTCPAHFCATCTREDRAAATKPCSQLFQCIRCPVAFHDADLCSAAGSVELSLSNVICPRHFEDNLIKMSSYKPSHPDWCFKCFKSGPKLLCHNCPSSFHVHCIKHPKNESPFICDDCHNYRQPRYGEILFVKVSQYRWWPSEIIHPRNAPMNILRLKRPDGTFPIFFLGSHEYQWVSRSRTIHYNTAALSTIVKDSGGVTKMDRDFTFGLARADKMHKVYVNILLKHVPLTSLTAELMTKSDILPYLDFHDSDKKTVKYRFIKENIVVPPAKWLPLYTNPPSCECRDQCQLYQCNNYINKVECDRYVCPLQDHCLHHFFSNHINKNLGVTKTGNRGFGLRTMTFLNQNEFIIEYLGEIITKTVCYLRMNLAKRHEIKDFYMMRLNDDLVIDAGPKGNLSRFINHSCDPNCRIERWTVNNFTRIGVFAMKSIECGEELTVDYRVSRFIMMDDIFCLCNSSTCTVFLGPDKVKIVTNPKLPIPALRKEPTPIKPKKIERISKSDNYISKTIDVNANVQMTQKATEMNDFMEMAKKPCLIVDSSSQPSTTTETSTNAAPFIGFISNTDFKKIMHRINPPLEPRKEQESVIDLTHDIEHTNKANADIKLDPIKEFLSKLAPIKPLNKIQEPIGRLAPKPIPINKSLKIWENMIDAKKRPEPIKICPKRPIQSGESVNKESAVQTDASIESKDRTNPVKKIDPIKESLRATDRAIESLSKKILIKEPARKTRLFDEYLKKIDNLKESRNKPAPRVDGLRKIVPRKEPTTKIVPFEEYVKKIEHLKELQKKTDVRTATDSIVNIVPKKELTTDIVPTVESTDPEATESNQFLALEEVVVNEAEEAASLNDSDSVVVNQFLNEDNTINDPDENEPKKDTVFESFCFRCFDGGELVLCDKPGCTKTYHLSCIGLKKAPCGTWYCPWHFCDICGDPSDFFCVQCPVSYCRSHCDDCNMLKPAAGSQLSLCRFHNQWKEALTGVTSHKEMKTEN